MVHKSGHPFQRTLSTALSPQSTTPGTAYIHPSSHIQTAIVYAHSSLFSPSLEALSTSPSSLEVRFSFAFPLFTGPTRSVPHLLFTGSEPIRSRALFTRWHTNYSCSSLAGLTTETPSWLVCNTGELSQTTLHKYESLPPLPLLDTSINRV